MNGLLTSLDVADWSGAEELNEAESLLKMAAHI